VAPDPRVAGSRDTNHRCPGTSLHRRCTRGPTLEGSDRPPSPPAAPRVRRPIVRPTPHRGTRSARMA